MTYTNEIEPAGVAPLTHEARAALQAEPIGVRRLREAREAHAALQAEQAASAPLPVRPADTFHCLTTGATIATGQGFLSTAHITRAGENIIVTQNMIDASYSASGRSWMALLGNDDAQLAKWGEVRFRLGPAPADVQTWTQHGDSDWVEQREAARREAWSQPTAQARAAALAAVEKRFGPAPTTSVTLNTTADPSIRQAEEQRRALDEGGTRLAWAYEAREPGQAGDRR